jgi:hypothetical protein
LLGNEEFLDFLEIMMADHDDASEAGKALGKLGASKGGRARASTLTKEEKSEIARKAVTARWDKV